MNTSLAVTKIHLLPAKSLKDQKLKCVFNQHFYPLEEKCWVYILSFEFECESDYPLEKIQSWIQTTGQKRIISSSFIIVTPVDLKTVLMITEQESSLRWMDGNGMKKTSFLVGSFSHRSIQYSTCMLSNSANKNHVDSLLYLQAGKTQPHMSFDI